MHEILLPIFYDANILKVRKHPGHGWRCTGQLDILQFIDNGASNDGHIFFCLIISMSIYFFKARLGKLLALNWCIRVM